LRKCKSLTFCLLTYLEAKYAYFLACDIYAYGVIDKLRRRGGDFTWFGGRVTVIVIVTVIAAGSRVGSAFLDLGRVEAFLELEEVSFILAGCELLTRISAR